MQRRRNTDSVSRSSWKRIFGNPFKKKKQEEEGKYKKVAQPSALELRKANIKTSRTFKIKINTKLIKRFLLGRYVVATLVIIAVVLLGYYMAVHTNVLLIKKVNLVNSDQISSERIALLEKAASQFLNQNLFKVSAAEFEEKIKSEVADIKEVYVIKYFPDKIEFEVQFRIPTLAVATYSNMLILDENNEIIINDNSDKLVITEFERNVLDNKVDLNSNSLREAYAAKLTTEEEKQQLIWAEVPEETKRSLIEELKNQINAKVSTFQSTILSKANEVYNVPLILINQDIEISQVDTRLEEKIIFSKEILKGLASVGQYNVVKFVWKDNFNLQVLLDNSATLIFINNREISDQLEDYEALVWNSKIESGRTYDLRIPTISVR